MKSGELPAYKNTGVPARVATYHTNRLNAAADYDEDDEGMAAGSYQDGDDMEPEMEWRDRRYIRDDWPRRGYYGGPLVVL